MHVRRQVGLFNVVQAMKRFAKNPLDDAQILGASAAAGQPRGRRQDLQLIPQPQDRHKENIS